MSADEDSRLRREFAKLREEDRRAAPPFHRMTAVAPRRSGWRIAVAAMAIVVVAVMLVVRGRRSTDVVPHELAGWSSPTAFLLETPGKEVLHQTPRFGEPLIS